MGVITSYKTTQLNILPDKYYVISLVILSIKEIIVSIQQLLNIFHLAKWRESKRTKAGYMNTNRLIESLL